MGIAGFILAIIGLIFNPIAIPSLLGVIFSAIGLGGRNKGLAIAGLILGIIGAGYTILYMLGYFDALIY